MRYTVLNKAQNKELVECVNLAFSDYAMPIHFTEDSLLKFFEASHVNTSLSFCAYSKNVMVGFILNSSSTYNGEQVAFDAATGVIPEFRNKGIFSHLLTYVKQELCKKGIKKYYLEVLQQNDKAKALYERNGFSVVREFTVLQCLGISEKNTNQCIQDVKYTEFDFSDTSILTIVKPSYEHSRNMIKMNAHLYKVVYLRNKSGITAFCVYCAENGRMIELGYSNLSDLKEVVIYIASHYKMAIAKNIDTAYNSVIDMLLSIGFIQVVNQYEMVKELEIESY